MILLAVATAARERAIAALEGALEATRHRGAEDLPPPSEHRGNHRPGNLPRLAQDAELRAFVEARLDRRTFQEIADAVAVHFPPERRIRHSAIHEWHRRLRDRRD